jgi:hypothetical protein
MLITLSCRSNEGISPIDIARQIQGAGALVEFFDSLPKSSEPEERHQEADDHSWTPSQLSPGDAERVMEQVISEIENEAMGGISQASRDLLAATMDNDLQGMLKAMEAGADVNVQDPKIGMRPLHLSVVTGNFEALTKMLQWGADVNSLQGDGPLGGGGRLTPLMCACIPRTMGADLPPIEVQSSPSSLSFSCNLSFSHQSSRVSLSFLTFSCCHAVGS